MWERDKIRFEVAQLSRTLCAEGHTLLHRMTTLLE